MCMRSAACNAFYKAAKLVLKPRHWETDVHHSSATGLKLTPFIRREGRQFPQGRDGAHDVAVPYGPANLRVVQNIRHVRDRRAKVKYRPSDGEHVVDLTGMDDSHHRITERHRMDVCS